MVNDCFLFVRHDPKKKKTLFLGAKKENEARPNIYKTSRNVIKDKNLTRVPVIRQMTNVAFTVRRTFRPKVAETLRHVTLG